MSLVNGSLPAVLCRRVRTLEQDGYNDDFLKALRTATDELEARRRFEAEPEAVYLEAVSDNRRLRRSLVDVFHMIGAQLNKKHRALDIIKKALEATKPIGQGRGILAIEVTPASTRADLEEHVRKVLDVHFAAKEQREKEEREAGEPGAGEQAARAGRE